MEPRRSTVIVSILFPSLLVVGTFPWIIGSSGEDGAAAGVIYSLLTLPFFFAGYLMAKNMKKDLLWIYYIFPLWGFMPLAYAIKYPFSGLLTGLILVISVFSARIEEETAQPKEVTLALSALACLGLPGKSLIFAGLIGVISIYYLSRSRLSLQCLFSYFLLFLLLGWDIGFDPVVYSMGIFFEISISFLLYLAEVGLAKLRTNDWGSNPGGRRF
ncbi:hypothetical protein [Thermococcus sp.]|uniref:hypothetical protein n=1 Tax=Thermococcus sp. TaxID=35749 RepID=UPI00261A06DD|nr:hypothetical protein [Thermococcus sp.]